MKTIKQLTVITITSLLAVFSAVFFTACENIIALGSRLNMEGPVVTITYPPARMPVDGKLYIAGKVSDNVSVDLISVKARFLGTDNESDFKVQWRYTSKGWEYSLDDINWQAVQPVVLADGTSVKPEFNGTVRNASWTLPIDFNLAEDYINEIPPGLYQFTVTAYNNTGLSDENSFKTRTIIYYKDPPVVSIISPSSSVIRPVIEDEYIDSQIDMLMSLTDWHDPIYLGKILNNEFSLQWQIKDDYDVWSIELYFYEVKTNASDKIISYTDYENDYVFKMYINDINSSMVPGPIPPENTLRPSGRIKIPDLQYITNGEKFDPESGAYYEVKNTIIGKTALQIVARCKNAAGKEVEEPIHRNKGCFVYWPDSDEPWITFPDGLSTTSSAADMYAVFPADPDDPYSGVPAKAFDDDGVDKVVYNIYKTPFSSTDVVYSAEVKNDMPTKNFSWTFKPPAELAVYKIVATVYDTYGKTSSAEGYFKTQDVSLPEIEPPYNPDSTIPLYRSPNVIDGTKSDNWNFTIKGRASDATGVKSVYMVWINPFSANYSAMSQLAYFRDDKYEGWLKAETYWNGKTVNQGVPQTDPYSGIPQYDSNYPNKVWRLYTQPNPANGGINDRLRKEVEYSITLNLKEHLKIWPGKATLTETDWAWLVNQVFVFKVTGGNDDKSAIIVWSPEGCSQPPEVGITSVGIRRYTSSGLGALTSLNLTSAEEIEALNPGDQIEASGTWSEDSAKYLGKTNALEFFKVYISDVLIQNNSAQNTTFTLTPSDDKADTGTWKATATVGDSNSFSTHALRVGHLKDTLMVNAEITNIGRHKSEAVKSWFVKSDQLKFLQIGTLSAAQGDIKAVSDKTYKAGDVIDFFLEFNKSVTLHGGNPTSALNAHPILNMNSGTGGNQAVARYLSSSTTVGQTAASNRHYFRYTVGANDCTINDGCSTASGGNHASHTATGNLLNIISLNDTLNGVKKDPHTDNDYPFSFVTSAVESETLRLVMPGTQNCDDSNHGDHRVSVLPVESTNGAFRTIKTIHIDTTPPRLSNVQISGRGGWYGFNDTIIISATFTEPVYINTSSPPKLKLLISNGSSTTEQDTDSVIQNGNTLLFSYNVKSGDFTPNAGDVQITAFTGIVTDFEGGNQFVNNITGFTTPKDARGDAAKVKAIPLSVPTLEVYSDTTLPAGDIKGTSDGDSATWDPSMYPDSAAFNNSSITMKKLNNYYFDNLYILIKPNAANFDRNFDRIEYSINYGRDWSRVTSFVNTGANPTNHNIRINPNVQGQYDLTVRHVDDAGNASPWSKPVTLFWDKGDLLTRISTEKPSGTYTDNTDGNIDITLTFRKPVAVKSPVKIELNVGDRRYPEAGQTYNDITIPVNSMPSSTITVNYQITQYDTTFGKALEVKNLVGLDAFWDEANTNVSELNMVNLEQVTKTQRNLHHQKSIIIQTGRPELVTGYPQFSFTNVNDDDSVRGTITLRYSSDVILRGLGEIEIAQKYNGYRLPGVLTEAQYNLYSGIPNLKKYYKKGTNGYNNSTSKPDISTKYILDFNVDTFSSQYMTRTVNTDRTITYANDGTLTDELSALKLALWEAEKVKIMAASSFVAISGNTVTITFNSTNSLKVQGAEYEIIYPEGFMQDNLGNQVYALHPASVTNKPCCPTSTHITDSRSSIPASGVGSMARPFIRAFKPTEKISSRTGTASLPRFYVEPEDRATRAWIRLDTRTPGANVRYGITSSVNGTGTNVTGVNITQQADNGALSSEPARPALGTGAIGGTDIYSGGNPLQVGDTPGSAYTLVQGLKVRIHAVSRTGTTDGTANPADEMLYRSVLTFEGQSGTMSNQKFGVGDQVWVRGGNNSSSTTIAGFPLSWQDNYTNLRANTEQAGIRLLTRIGSASSLTDTTTTLELSRWQWITWDINASAYIKLFLGRDVEETIGGATIRPSTAAEAMQFGPKTEAVQRENWTYLIELYKIHPGQHRYLTTGTPSCSDSNGRIEGFYFNGTPERRGVNTVTGCPHTPAQQPCNCTFTPK